MAKISFEKSKSPDSPSVDIEVQEPRVQEVAVEVQEKETVGLPARTGGDVQFYDEDDSDLSEVSIPRLNIVQKVGPLSEDWDPGVILLDKSLVVYSPAKGKDPEVPAEITVLGFRPTQWTERVAGGEFGRLFQTEQEVYANGGTTDYEQWKTSCKTKDEIPYFQRLATCLVLLKRPAGVDEEKAFFSYEFGGADYAVAQWSMKGAAYTAGAKVIKSARKMGHLRKGFCSAPYLLTTKAKSFGEQGHSAIIPVLKPGHAHTPEFVAFARGILGVDESAKGTVD